MLLILLSYFFASESKFFPEQHVRLANSLHNEWYPFTSCVWFSSYFMLAFDSHFRDWLKFVSAKHAQTRKNRIDWKEFFILIELE